MTRAEPPGGRARTAPSAGRLGLVLALVLAACTAPDPWPGVRRADRPATYRAYLAEHPGSEHAPEASARLAALAAEAERAAAAEAAASAVTLADYRELLRRYPDSEHAATARVRIARLEEEEAWRSALDDGAVEAQREFLARYPESEHAPACREAIARSDREQELAAALAAAREADTLAGWESFWRRFPQDELSEEQRAEAGGRIEELGTDPEVERVRERIAPLDAERREHGVPFYVAEIEVAPPGTGDELLMKDADHRYLAIGREHVRPAPEAFELPLLRYTRPREVLVLRLAPRTLASAAEIGEAERYLYFTLAHEHLGLDLSHTTWITLAREPAAFGPPDATEVHSRRGFVVNALPPDEWVESLPSFEAEDRAWILGHLEDLGWTPSSPRQRALLALAAGDFGAAAELGPDVRPDLLEVLRGADFEVRVDAARALALLDPSGAVFEALSGIDDVLFEACRGAPRLAAELTSPRAREASRRARESLLQDFEGEDDAARFAARNLAFLGWDAEAPAHVVRSLALEDRWGEIPALGEAAVEPLARMLPDASEEWREPVVAALEELAGRVGPSAAADRVLLVEPRVRWSLVVHGRRRLDRLFGAEARAYLEAARAPEPLPAVRAFVADAEDRAWSAVLAEWEADAGGRPALDLIEDGRITARASGQGIEVVPASFHNHTDHPVLVRVPAGLRFVRPGGEVQDMVTTADVELELPGGRSGSRYLDVVCANLHRSVPTILDHFELQRVDPASELGRALAALPASGLDFPARQAAVWIVTDDASYAQLGRLVRGELPSLTGVGPPRRRGERVIEPVHVVQALRVLEDAGLDVRSKRVFADAEQLAAELEEGEPKRWLEARL